MIFCSTFFEQNLGPLIVKEFKYFDRLAVTGTES